MKPKTIPVKTCRVCKSDSIRDLEITREYYLANLDQTIPMTYAICLECNFIFQGEYVGDDFLNYHYSHSCMLRTQDLDLNCQVVSISELVNKKWAEASLVD